MWNRPRSTRLAVVDADFVAALEEYRLLPCEGADNLKLGVMVFAVLQSTKEERKVELAEFG